MWELISIIVPVYNIEKYIGQCIESIVSQTYTNIEIILVDDGSSDDSGKICDFYAGQDNRIIVLHKKNEGVSIARNAGLDRMRGAYCLFIDGDDWISENFVEELTQQCDEENLDFAFVNHYMCNNDGNCRCTIYSYSHNQHFDRNAALLDFLKYSVAVTGKLYKKEFFQNIRFPIGIRIAEDELAQLKVLMNINKTAFNANAIYYRRERPGSASRKVKLTNADLKAAEIHEFVAEKILESSEQLEKNVCHFMVKKYSEILLKINAKENKEIKTELLNRYRYWYARGGYLKTLESKSMNMRFCLLAISPSFYCALKKIIKK